MSQRISYPYRSPNRTFLSLFQNFPPFPIIDTSLFFSPKAPKNVIETLSSPMKNGVIGFINQYSDPVNYNVHFDKFSGQCSVNYPLFFSLGLTSDFSHDYVNPEVRGSLYSKIRTIFENDELGPRCVSLNTGLFSARNLNKNFQIQIMMEIFNLSREFSVPVHIDIKSDFGPLFSDLLKCIEQATPYAFYAMGHWIPDKELIPFLDLGGYIIYSSHALYRESGIKNRKTSYLELQNLIPPDRLLLSSGYPYAPNVPPEGVDFFTSRNEKLFLDELPNVLFKLSELRNIDPTDLSLAIFNNTLSLFPKIHAFYDYHLRVELVNQIGIKYTSIKPMHVKKYLPTVPPSLLIL